jgi:hypothetical protein
MVAGRPGVRQVGGRRCLVISLIMSPHNCNETLSPSKDGHDESERVPMSESDRELQQAESEPTLCFLSAAADRAPGAAAQTPLSIRSRGLGAARQSLHALAGFASQEQLILTLARGKYRGFNDSHLAEKTTR